MYSNILVAVDGSKTSIAALNHAVKLARAVNSKISVITIIDELKLPFAAHHGLWAKESHEKLFRSVLEEINKLVREIRMKEKGILIDSILLEGTPAKKIVEYAVQGNFDLIIMGGSGYSKIDRMLLGSVTEAVVNTSQTPILIVK